MAVDADTNATSETDQLTPTHAAHFENDLSGLKSKVSFLLVFSTIISICFVTLSVACGVFVYYQMSVIGAIPYYIGDDKGSKVLHLSLDNSSGVNQVEGVLRSWKQKDNVQFAFYENGFVTIKEDATYEIYVKLSFDIEYGKLSFVVYLDNEEFMKCTWAESGIKDADGQYTEWVSPCYTSRAAYLKSGQALSVKVPYGDLPVNTIPSMTYWGIVQIK